jgi:hypothetical protein
MFDFQLAKRLTSIILTTQEAEIWKTTVRSLPGQKVIETPISIKS